VKTGIRINPRGKRKHGAQWKDMTQKEAWKKRKADPVYPTGGEERNVTATEAELCIRLRLSFAHENLRGYWYEGRYIVRYVDSTLTAMVWDKPQWYINDNLRWGGHWCRSIELEALNYLIMSNEDMTRMRRWGIAGVAVGMNG